MRFNGANLKYKHTVKYRRGFVNVIGHRIINYVSFIYVYEATAPNWTKSIQRHLVTFVFCNMWQLQSIKSSYKKSCHWNITYRTKGAIKCPTDFRLGAQIQATHLLVQTPPIFRTFVWGDKILTNNFQVWLAPISDKQDSINIQYFLVFSVPWLQIKSY